MRDADGNDIGLHFSPDVLRVAAGTSVRWINKDDIAESDYIDHIKIADFFK
jgi:plastocyanin